MLYEVITDILKNKSTAQLFTDVLKQIEIKANDSALKGRLRITSYNVCYTKLLRMVPIRMSNSV